MNLARLVSAATSLAIASVAPAVATAPPSAAATVASDGTLVGGVAVSGASRSATGTYSISFTDPDVPTACAYTASVGPTAPGGPTPGFVNVGAGPDGTINVWTFDMTRTAADMAFEVYVAC